MIMMDYKARILEVEVAVMITSAPGWRLFPSLETTPLMPMWTCSRKERRLSLFFSHSWSRKKLLGYLQQDSSSVMSRLLVNR